MYHGANGPHDQQGGGQSAQASLSARQENNRIITLSALSIVLALFLASFYPQPLVLAMFSTLMVLVAMASSFTALILRQDLFGPRLTLWDKSATLAVAGLAAGLVVDPEAVQVFIDAANAPAAAVEAPSVPAAGPHF
ncbi:MAG: hypothetical protein AAF811_00745 [Pseudomonadota bacterium]